MTDSQIRFQLPFRDRVQASRVLASILKRFTGRRDIIVFGLPRGGVIVAAEVAQRWDSHWTSSSSESLEFPSTKSSPWVPLQAVAVLP